MNEEEGEEEDEQESYGKYLLQETRPGEGCNPLHCLTLTIN